MTPLLTTGSGWHCHNHIWRPVRSDGLPLDNQSCIYIDANLWRKLTVTQLFVQQLFHAQNNCKRSAPLVHFEGKPSISNTKSFNWEIERAKRLELIYPVVIFHTKSNIAPRRRRGKQVLCESNSDLWFTSALAKLHANTYQLCFVFHFESLMHRLNYAA